MTFPVPRYRLSPPFVKDAVPRALLESYLPVRADRYEISHTLGAPSAGLRTAWAEGEARTTVRPPAKPKRERHPPDPLVKVTEQLRAWFEAEPWTTNRQLLERPQAAHPGVYPDGLLRTV